MDWIKGRPIVATPAFLGYVFIILIFWGFRQYFKRPELRLWLIGFLVFFMVSIGPYLKVNGILYDSIVLPAYFLRFFPLLESTRTLARYLAMVMLFTSIIVCLVLKPAVERMRPRPRIFFYAGLLGIVLFEYGMIPYPYQGKITNYQVPEVYQVLKNEAKGEAGVLLDLPLSFHSGVRSEGKGEIKRLYYQTLHQQKLISGVSSKLDDSLFAYFNKQPAIPSLLKALPVKEDELAALIYSFKVNWIVMDTRYFEPQYLAVYQDLFHKVSYIKPFHRDRRFLGFKVDQTDYHLKKTAITHYP
jgi:hypothetical protein